MKSALLKQVLNERTYIKAYGATLYQHLTDLLTHYALTNEVSNDDVLLAQ